MVIELVSNNLQESPTLAVNHLLQYIKLTQKMIELMMICLYATNNGDLINTDICHLNTSIFFNLKIIKHFSPKPIMIAHGN